MKRNRIEKGVRGVVLPGGAAGVVATVLLLAGPSQAQDVQPVWSYDSDGSWIAEVVSIGNEGTQVFAEYGAYLNARALFSGGDTNPPSPVWTDSQTDFNFNRVVASAARGGIHASMHQEYSDAYQVWKKAVLRKYSSDSSTPDWSYQFDTLIANHNYSLVKVAADGSRVVGAVYDSSSMKTEVAVFGEFSGTPLITYAIDTLGAFEGFALSEDGSTMVFRSSMRLIAVDVDTGTVELDQFLINSTFFGALDISADGSVIAMGTSNTVVTYERDDLGAYSQAHSTTLAPGDFSGRLGLSMDGTKLYYSVNNFSTPARVEVQGIELSSGSSLLSYEALGTGSLLNLATSVQVSADGTRIAVGLWGDEGQTVPELLFFAAGNDAPISSFDAAGSILSLDMSPSGHHVAAAARNEHATVLGGGGSIMLFETPDLDLVMDGVPQAGTTVNLSQRLDGSAISRIIVSPALDPTPDFFPSAGYLYVDRTLMSWLPSGASNGQGEVVTPYAIPSDSAWVGTSLYFQGVGLAPRGLSDNYVKMTVLP